MANKVENHKKFMVLRISRDELIDKLGIYGALGICDNCNSQSFTGFYVAVLNRWLCPKCYKHFIRTSERYFDDIPIESKNFERYCKLFGVEP